MTEHYAAAVKLRCPNEDEPAHGGLVEYDLAVRPVQDGSKFRCTSCGFAFTATTAQVRRMLVRRVVMA